VDPDSKELEFFYALRDVKPGDPKFATEVQCGGVAMRKTSLLVASRPID